MLPCRRRKKPWTSLSTEAPERKEQREPRPDREPRFSKEDREMYNYKETGKATTSLKDLLKDIKL